jgi:cytochrome c-type protein NapB
MQRAITNDVRVRRNYPDQPPVIPHAIEGYALDLNANKCMSCHARRFTEQSQAPMISVTHYQDREGNTLGGLAPRRYACLACHVPQTEARPLVENRFQDMDALTEPERQPGGRSNR